MGSGIRQTALGLILAATTQATPLVLGTASATPSWQLLSGYASPFGDGIYDPVDRRIVLFTGYNIYQLDLDAPEQSWWPLPSTGIPSCPPDFWNNARVIYDPVNHRAIVHRTNDCGGGLLSEVWEVALGSVPVWSQLTPSGTPPDGHMPATIYDPVGQRMIAFGDWGYLSNRVWALSLDGPPAWTELLPTGTPPVASWYFTVAYDPIGHRMIVTGIGDPPYQTWALSLGGSPAWTRLSTTNPLTYSTYSTDMFVDPPSNDLILVGGEVLDLTTYAWSKLPVPGNWCSRGEAIYDPVAGSVYKWGGISSVETNCRVRSP